MQCPTCQNDEFEVVDIETHQEGGQRVTDDGTIWTSTTHWKRCTRCGYICDVRG